MVAVTAADDGAALAVAQASAKLLASLEVDELEADYAKSGYYLATRLLGEDEVKTKEPQLSKKYRVDRGFHNISGSTVFKLFKSRWVPGCTAAGRIP
jgi:hypothetical protein